MTNLTVSEVRFLKAPAQYRAGGLLGWTTCVVDNGLGVALGVRRTADGRLSLSFPGRLDRQGRVHNSTWPIDQATRDAFEARVFEELRAQGVAL
jgi:hypothetical protein